MDFPSDTELHGRLIQPTCERKIRLSLAPFSFFHFDFLIFFTWECHRLVTPHDSISHLLSNGIYDLPLVAICLCEGMQYILGSDKTSFSSFYRISLYSFADCITNFFHYSSTIAFPLSLLEIGDYEDEWLLLQCFPWKNKHKNLLWHTHVYHCLEYSQNTWLYCLV